MRNVLEFLSVFVWLLSIVLLFIFSAVGIPILFAFDRITSKMRGLRSQW